MDAKKDPYREYELYLEQAQEELSNSIDRHSSLQHILNPDDIQESLLTPFRRPSCPELYKRTTPAVIKSKAELESWSETIFAGLASIIEQEVNASPKKNRCEGKDNQSEESCFPLKRPFCEKMDSIPSQNNELPASISEVPPSSESPQVLNNGDINQRRKPQFVKKISLEALLEFDRQHEIKKQEKPCVPFQKGRSHSDGNNKLILTIEPHRTPKLSLSLPSQKQEDRSPGTPMKPDEVVDFLKRVGVSIQQSATDAATQTTPPTISPVSSCKYLTDCACGDSTPSSKRESSDSSEDERLRANPESSSDSDQREMNSSGSLSQSLDNLSIQNVSLEDLRDSETPSEDLDFRGKKWEGSWGHHSDDRKLSEEVWVRRSNVKQKPYRTLPNPSKDANQLESDQRSLPENEAPKENPTKSYDGKMKNIGTDNIVKGRPPTGNYCRQKLKPLKLKKAYDLAAAASNSTCEVGEYKLRKTSPDENAHYLRREKVRSISSPTAECEELVKRLDGRSSSAPLLDATKIEKKPHHQSAERAREDAKRQAELESSEACRWLRAAGFPQYAQMYEELQFPIDISCVQKDHLFLDPDALQSLYRRLHALNRCAKLRLNSSPAKKLEDSDEDEQCALSENWQFELNQRRWSRISTPRMIPNALAHGNHKGSVESMGSSDSSPRSPKRMEEPPSNPAISSRSFWRSGSERLNRTGRGILNRVGSFKTRKKKLGCKENVVISDPKPLDAEYMKRKTIDLNCTDITPPDSGNPSPDLTYRIHQEDSSSCRSTSDLSLHSTPQQSQSRRGKRLFKKNKKSGSHAAFSDSESSPYFQRHDLLSVSDIDSVASWDRESPKVGARPRELSIPAQSTTVRRSGSFTLHPGTPQLSTPEDERRSFYDNVPVIIYNKSYRDDDPTINSSDPQISMRSDEPSGSSEVTLEADSDCEEVASRQRSAAIIRWHSFQRNSLGPFIPPASPKSTPLTSLSCGQLLVLRKMALLKLTSLMERYCPSNRSTGWNWDLPKFIKKIKTPDYKEKSVFGVPLLMIVQRTGQAIPQPIQKAVDFLRDTSLDQEGLFRKCGSQSRITKLKQLCEEWEGEGGPDFQENQAYDVADMIKQFFRELPEALLTNKLSETFIAIFQYIPLEQRREALRAAILLIPDENREVLFSLLYFLSDVAIYASTNQMSASNLALCLAPSLFHISTPRSTSSSPRRRKTVGIPDQRDLNENKAACECLTTMIRDYPSLFSVPHEWLSRCHFSFLEQSQPVSLESLGQDIEGIGSDWASYLEACVKGLMREVRESGNKPRGWVGVVARDPLVEVSYKKVRDGHRLRLWRCATEVEAPPTEVLQRVLHQREMWDSTLLSGRTVAKLNDQTDVYHYTCTSPLPQPPRDYCVVRTWRSHVAGRTCIIAQTSVEHSAAPCTTGTTRGIVLASRYLIEPCGAGKSRITHIARVDDRGRTPDWYNRVYGHMCSFHLGHLRESFAFTTDGPESKV